MLGGGGGSGFSRFITCQVGGLCFFVVNCIK
jgi:hypothetical protein